MSDVFVSTVPFDALGDGARRLMHDGGIDFVVNPIGRRLQESELVQLVGESRVLIAGTEPVTATVMDAAPRLELIARVGIGLDNVDLIAARERGIEVTYTPDAPAPAVAELTIGLIISLLRHIQVANLELHAGTWQRHAGSRISEVCFGVIGFGRIGQRVVNFLQSLGAQRILINDVRPREDFKAPSGIEWATKEQIWSSADVVTLHTPLTDETHHLVDSRVFSKMKAGAVLVNTARGGVVDEAALFDALTAGDLAAAAVDVFEQEPYSGPLTALPQCLLTAHMGSMSIDCRTQMEVEATQEAISFLKGEPLRTPVPDGEYEIQMQRPT